MPKPTKRSHPVDVVEAGPSRAKRVRPAGTMQVQKHAKAAMRKPMVSKARKQKEEESEDEVEEQSEEEELESDEEEIGAMSGESDTSSGEDDDEDDEDEDSQVGSEDEESEDEDIPVSLEDCLEKPIYTLEEVDVKDATGVFAYQGCILCPSKVLKNQTMVDVHVKSGAHLRAKRRMAERLLDPDSITSEDPRIIVAEIEAKLFEQRGGADRESQAEGKSEKRDKEKKDGDKEELSRAERKKDRKNKVAMRIEARKARRAVRDTEVAQ